MSTAWRMPVAVTTAAVSGCNEHSSRATTLATLETINDFVVEATVTLGLEDGSELRVDTTVVETDIRHPTDNTLLWDVVRVLTRLPGRLAMALELRRIATKPLRCAAGTCSPP
jgi:hypothetical protein